MINNIINIYKDKETEFEGATTFSNINTELQEFALAIHKTINTKFPQVFKMTDEEYKQVDKELQIWLKTDEAINTNTKFQLESLSEIIVECVNTMYQLEKDNKVIEDVIYSILEKKEDGSKTNKSQD